MDEIILHHYPTSPFSEKVRLILGYKQLAWRSVIVPSIMPKPDVLALTGGYRKTPFLQIGADVYCDTALICDVLEQRQAQPSLFPTGHKGLARTVAQWADSTLFWAAMAYNFSPKGAASMFADAPAEYAKAFATDRGQMSAVGMTRLRPADATAAYKSYLRRLSDMLHEHAFLLGDTPCVADFAAYHPLWFSRVRVPVMAPILDATPLVLAWMDRMAAFGHGAMQPMSAIEAIAVAQQSTPQAADESVFQDEHGLPLDSEVSISAEIFGQEPTVGVLVAATRMHYTLRRTDERAGTVQVHFPRVGYTLKKLEA